MKNFKAPHQHDVLVVLVLDNGHRVGLQVHDCLLYLRPSAAHLQFTSVGEPDASAFQQQLLDVVLMSFGTRVHCLLGAIHESILRV